jgi:hypothetical protein
LALILQQQSHRAVVKPAPPLLSAIKVRKTLPVTPPEAAGVVETLWTMEDIADWIEARWPKPGSRRPHKKRSA